MSSSSLTASQNTIADQSEKPAAASVNSKEETEVGSASSSPDLEAAKLPAKEADNGGSSDEEIQIKDDVIVVDWEGETDPLFPKNWSFKSRMGATLVVASFTFLSPLSSTMIAPSSSAIALEFGMTNEVTISMVTSIFVLAYAIGPLFLSPLSEIYGRAHVLQVSNLVYLIFNLACGFAQSPSQLLAFRFFAGLGGSGPLGIGAGVIGDIWRPEQRGKAVAIYSIGPLLGPSIGPLAGGWITEKLGAQGWRWVFWSTTIFCALVQLVGARYLHESYSPVLLKRKAQALKQEMGLEPDSDKVQTVFEVKDGKQSPLYVVAHGFMRPYQMIWREPIIQILSLYMALVYGVIYISIVSTTPIFTEIYGESVGVAGSNFVAQGLGFIVWAQIGGRLLDVVYRKLKLRYGTNGKPEYRIVMMVPASIFLPLGLLIYGWSAQHHLHWFLVDIGLFILAAGMIGTFQSIQTYLIDTFTLYAASAVAGASSLRSLCGFGFPLFAPAMFNSLGYGWGCTVLALIAIVVGLPAAPLLFVYGERIREKSRYTKGVAR